MAWFRHEIPFLTKFASKNQNCLFKMKFGNWTKSNTLNSTVMLKLFYLERKYPFWVNLVQKFKIVCLRWNLVQKLFQIFVTWWRLVKISENISVLQSVLLNFKIVLELQLSFYFSLINCFLIKHVLKKFHWVVNYVNISYYKLITCVNNLCYNKIDNTAFRVIL